MKDIILFVSVFVIVYLVYFIFVVNRKKSLNKLQDGKELIYLKKCYKLNYSKINIKSIANAIALGNAFVISFVASPNFPFEITFLVDKSPVLVL